MLGLEESAISPCSFIDQDPVGCGGWLQASNLEISSSSEAGVLDRRQCSSVSCCSVFRRFRLSWCAFVASDVSSALLILCSSRFLKKKKRSRHYNTHPHALLFSSWCQFRGEKGAQLLLVIVYLDRFVLPFQILFLKRTFLVQVDTATCY